MIADLKAERVGERVVVERSSSYSYIAIASWEGSSRWV